MRFEYEQSLIADKELEKKVEKLLPYKGHLREVFNKGGYTKPECSINLPKDDEILDEVYRTADRIGVHDVKYIFVVGIGGSNLGTKAIYDALSGFSDIYDAERYPRMFFIDTNNGRSLTEAFDLIKEKVHRPEEILINAVSKSGATMETILNLELLASVLTDQLDDREEAKKRLVITTDEDTKLDDAAREMGIATLSIPKKVGGRYSVFSSVGLFPLHCGGYDINSLRTGARHACEHSLGSTLDSEDAMRSAIISGLHYKQGVRIHDDFLFNAELESLGKWYRQLLGESIGKEKDRSKKIVHTGLTPTVSIGSTDLHSVGQLYLGGPKDKITTFIWSSGGRSHQTPKERFFPSILPMIDGNSTADILHAILEGVKISYKKHKLPYTEIVLNDINEYELGTLMQFRMIEVMYLGEIFNVNAFDQPNVESYKKETKKILEDK